MNVFYFALCSLSDLVFTFIANYIAGINVPLMTGIYFTLLFLQIILCALDIPFIMCIAASVGAIVCLVSAVFTAKALFTEKVMNKFVRVRYALSVLCNLFTAGFVVYFQLFNFWI